MWTKASQAHSRKSKRLIQESVTRCDSVLTSERNRWEIEHVTRIAWRTKYDRFTTINISKYEHFTRKINRTYSHLVCSLWFPVFMGGFSGNPSWENIRPLRACVYASIMQRFRTVQDVGQLRKGLDLKNKWFNSVTKIWWTLQLVGFSFDKKSANVVTWKDKDYKYISSAW